MCDVGLLSTWHNILKSKASLCMSKSLISHYHRKTKCNSLLTGVCQNKSICFGLMWLLMVVHDSKEVSNGTWEMTHYKTMKEHVVLDEILVERCTMIQKHTLTFTNLLISIPDFIPCFRNVIRPLYQNFQNDL